MARELGGESMVGRQVLQRKSRNVWKVAVGSEAAMESGGPREGHDPVETIPHPHPAHPANKQQGWDTHPGL